MPMLSFELKHSPEYVEFGPTLKSVSVDMQCVFMSLNFVDVWWMSEIIHAKGGNYEMSKFCKQIAVKFYTMNFTL